MVRGNNHGFLEKFPFFSLELKLRRQNFHLQQTRLLCQHISINYILYPDNREVNTAVSHVAAKESTNALPIRICAIL